MRKRWRKQKRWKIENEGFNRQKNHYPMPQISDFMKQLCEYYYLEKNGIKRRKNISSDLLANFGRQLIKEDTFSVDEYTQSFNRDKYSKESDACQEKMD